MLFLQSFSLCDIGILGAAVSSMVSNLLFMPPTIHFHFVLDFFFILLYLYLFWQGLSIVLVVLELTL